MIGKICGAICVVSFIFGICTGNIGQMSEAVIRGAADAVELTVSLIGIMCLWNGIMRVAQGTGMIDRLALLMSPLLRLLFPDAYKKSNGLGELAASISANIFGIGNAATPLAIKAMEKLQENNLQKDTATDDMIMFTVLGCGSLDLFPTTLIALRQSAASANPFEVVMPIWICSLATALMGILLVKTFCLMRKKE